MPIAKHILGGSVTFMLNGRTVTSSMGRVGDVPQHIIDKYHRQGRFEVIDDRGFPQMSADIKRGEAELRAPGSSEPGGKEKAGAVSGQLPPPKKEKPKEPEVERYIARHRGRGNWAVTEFATGKVVPVEKLKDKASELMPREEAEAEAERMNQENNSR